MLSNTSIRVFFIKGWHVPEVVLEQRASRSSDCVEHNNCAHCASAGKFSFHTSFTACYSDSTKSIHTLNIKQRMKGIMETEKDTTEKVELHCTSTLQVSFIPIIFFETVFFFSKYV